MRISRTPISIPGRTTHEMNGKETSMTRQPRSRNRRRVMSLAARTGFVIAVTVGLLAGLTPAALAAGSPQWSITVTSGPTNFAPGDASDQYLIQAVNTGSATTDGSPVTISDVLPAGVTAASVNGGDLFQTPSLEHISVGSFDAYQCANLATNTSCSATCPPPGATASCTFTGSFDVGDTLQMVVDVSVANSVSGTLVDSATVSGGGASDQTASAATPVSTTPPPWGIAPGSFLAATSTSQAGAHPNLTTSFTINRATSNDPVGNVRNVTLNLPPGMVGSATAVPACPSLAEVIQGGCPLDSMVGTAEVTVVDSNTVGSFVEHSEQTADVGVYNIAPTPGEPAAFGFYSPGRIPVRLDTSVRSGSDYGITATAANTPDPLPVLSTTVTLWGVPAEHNGPGPDLADCAKPTAVCVGETTGTGLLFGGRGGGDPAPLLTNPTQCSSGPLPVTLSVDSWSHGTAGPAASASASTSLPESTGCDALQFNPSTSLTPDTLSPDSPAGVNFDLSVPQNSDPNGLATPELENSTVTLPVGMVVSPSAADGLQGCTDAEIALHSTAPATCPNASDVGTVKVTSPLVPDPLTGQIFLGTPDCTGAGGVCTPQDASDGAMLRGFIQAQGDGVIVKLPGDFTVNTTTGQLTAHFDNNPQLPFSDLQLDFKGGPRGLVATPSTCGTFTTTSDFSPWSSPFVSDATPSSSFAISGCGSSGSSQTGFAPTFTAGSVNDQAGAYSPFTLTFSRSDSDQYFSGLTAALPMGELANLSNVPLCSDSDAAAGTCPASSQVGTAMIAAGPGSEPMWIPQAGAPQPAVYLTGPYEGAPYGLVVEAPAVAGPFNLGTVVVRQALFVNPTTAQATVKSDPFPTMLDGIPLQIRTVSIDMNRPKFTINPTSCTPQSVTGTLTSTGGLTANVSSRFQVGGCAALAFSPKLKIGLSGKGQTKSDDHPTLTATLTQGRGQANIRAAKVTLPLSMALDPNNSNHVCKYSVATAVHGGAVGCPVSTIVGKATAVTPLLSKPLTGNVYLVQGLRCAKGSISAQGTCAGGKTAIHTLPTLLVPLRGQIALDLRGKSSVNGAGALVTTFSTIPDAPVSKFTLQITGGKKGLLVITGRGQTICNKAQVASENLGAQSGKSVVNNDTLTTPCANGSRAKTSNHGHMTARK